jgi:hypothetical protein
MKNLIIQIQVPSGIDLTHLYQSVMDAIQLPENVTNAESQFIDSLLGQLESEAKSTPKMAIIWSGHDVIAVAEDMGVHLTEEQVLKVLEITLKGHDADYGVSWDSIRYSIEEVIK